MTLPADVRRGQPFDLRVVLVNNTEVPEGEDGNVTGKLRIMRRTSQRETLLVESDVVVPPGKTVIVPSVPETINNPDFYRYEAIFVPDDPEADVMVQNNRATAYTMVGGKGRVLIIEDKENRLDDGKTGQFDYLVERLQAQNISVTTMFTDNLFTDLADLQAYDTVVLANVPKASGESVAQLTHFSDAQVKTLESSQQLMGLRERRATHREPIELLEIEPQPLPEGAEGPGMNTLDSVDLRAARITDHASLRYVKTDRTAARRSRSAAHTT